MGKHTDAIRNNLDTLFPASMPETRAPVLEKLDAIDKERAEMVEALERITRVASVELSGKRDDVLEQARAILSKAKD